MNKILIGLGVIALVVVGWFLFQGDTIDYVAEVNDEVAALEAELAELDAAVQAGTLTPEQAAEAQTKIVARIDAINGNASSGQRAQLTDAQKAQLASGLQRLADALTRYKETLEAVDEAVLELPEAERPQLRRGGGGSRRGVAAIANETVVEVDTQIDEIIEDIDDEELAAEVASSTEESQMDEVEDDSATTTDETMDDTMEGSDDSVDESETGSDETSESEETSETEPTEETSTEEDSEVSVEAEADFSFSDSTEEEDTTNNQ